MTYQEYIDLGFKRFDMDDSVEFARTGYGGFSLEKIINNKLSICVNSEELDSPNLYISKKDEDTYHIIPITPSCVSDLLHD